MNPHLPSTKACAFTSGSRYWRDPPRNMNYKAQAARLKA